MKFYYKDSPVWFVTDPPPYDDRLANTGWTMDFAGRQERVLEMRGAYYVRLEQRGGPTKLLRVFPLRA